MPQIDLETFLELPDDYPAEIISSGELLIAELKDKDPESHAAVICRMGHARITQGEYESAFRSLSEARHLHEELGNERESLRSQLAFGSIYGFSEQPEAAFEVFLSIRDRAREAEYPELEEEADINMARICFDRERYEEGLGFIDAALKIIETTGNRIDQAEAIMERGRIELHRGRTEQAASDLEQARDILNSEGKSPGYNLLISLGDLYTRNQSFEKAREVLESSLELCHERHIPQGEILALFHLGNFMEATGDSEAAVDYWKRCFELTDTTVVRHLKIKSGEKLVAYFKDSGDTVTALEYLEEIRRIEGILRDERLHHTISVYDQSMRIDDLEQEMRSWRRRSGELEKIRSDREEAIREMKTITFIGEKITASLDPDTIVEVLYNSLSQLVVVDGLIIAFFDDDRSELDIRYIVENGKYMEPVRIPLEPDRSLTSWVVHNDRDMMVHSREDACRYTKAIRHIDGTDNHNESFLLVRLRIEGKIIGVMSVQAMEKNRYKESHLQVLQALASFIAIAMTNSSAHQSLVAANAKIAHMATHDPLTGLPNRMQIMNRLAQEIERCKRYNGSLAVLFIDLDGFKEINDSFGHRAGDGVLITIAERLNDGIRATDAAGRLAGDEFLVILTDNCTTEKGMILADQLRDRLSETMEFEGNKIGVTASIGLAICPDNAEDPGDLVNAADQAMYDAKATGKNRTCRHNVSGK